ncbi:hypothetical protein RSc1971 [Ralstonia pseudosolanacearum GMI1000]|uniref:Uncharacterized protein n=1 Tax=Ralstonia nicotianae (strain ATCC BAA-1114 / GMI1000) TaxID=267608 RepID=Q8XXZ2_RALN1|nr:hypothetical protein RSc1971 [Ralstonia pseudosolanacearum GMI1000]
MPDRVAWLPGVPASVLLIRLSVR